VNVRCTPREIPPALKVEVTDMEIGQSVHIYDIASQYPLLEFLDDPNVTLAHVSPPKKLEVTVAEAEEGAEEAAAEEPAAEEPSKEEAEGPGEDKQY
jgi:large subunit ribosomal protein L25